MDNNKDIEMESKTSAEADKGISQKESADDRPPTPPKRDFKTKDRPIITEPDGKRKTFGSFQRPEFIRKPESTESCMSCLKNLLIILNLLIWLFGAVLTGIGIWIRVDNEFWDLQTGLDMKQFAIGANILIAAGVVIMVIGFVGCYGAYAETLCMLILYAVVVILIILLEIAVMALVWTTVNNKDASEHIKSKARAAMQDVTKDEYKEYFLNLMQVKLECCGIDGPDDYEESGVPRSCTNPSTGYPYKQGCLETVVKYLKSKAAILGGVAIAVFLLQLAALVLTLCVACGLKNAASNSIF